MSTEHEMRPSGLAAAWRRWIVRVVEKFHRCAFLATFFSRAPDRGAAHGGRQAAPCCCYAVAVAAAAAAVAAAAAAVGAQR